MKWIMIVVGGKNLPENNSGNIICCCFLLSMLLKIIFEFKFCARGISALFNFIPFMEMRGEGNFQIIFSARSNSISFFPSYPDNLSLKLNSLSNQSRFSNPRKVIRDRRDLARLNSQSSHVKY